jgi:archaellum component FlaC
MAEADAVGYEEFEEADFYGEDGEDGGENNDQDNPAEPEDMNTRVLEMEEELNKLNNAQHQIEKQINTASDKLDELSMYVHISCKYSTW